MASKVSSYQESFQEQQQHQQEDANRRSPSLQEESDCVVMLDPSEHFRPENNKAVEEFRNYSEDQVSFLATLPAHSNRDAILTQYDNCAMHTYEIISIANHFLIIILPQLYKKYINIYQLIRRTTFNKECAKHTD